MFYAKRTVLIMNFLLCMKQFDLHPVLSNFQVGFRCHLSLIEILNLMVSRFSRAADTIKWLYPPRKILSRTKRQNRNFDGVLRLGALHFTVSFTTIREFRQKALRKKIVSFLYD